MGLLGAVERSLEDAGVARRGVARVVVACSGGADSVALAHAACALLGARRVVIGHVDHAVREGSVDDARFVAELAVELGAASASVRLDPGPPSEARLRELRYAALESMRAAAGADWILTGHTADDQAETVLFNLVRVARPAALAGIPRRRDAILRPMLAVSRAEVRAHLMSRGLAWREDPSNREPRWLRNRIRKELLPLLESRYRPGIASRLARLASALDAPHASSPERANTLAPSPVHPPVPSHIAIERRAWAGGPLPSDPRSAVFDADALDRVIVRAMRPGDRIRPWGLAGTKKLSDVLIDAKVPRDQRASLWLAAHPSGEVLWVPGLARAQTAPVSSATTQVWVLSCGPLAEAPLSLGGS